MNKSFGASETELKKEFIFVFPSETAVEYESIFSYETPTNPGPAGGRGFKILFMKNEKPSEDVWIDKQEIMMRMHISNRTLQTWRSKGILPFARIRKKIYYKESDLMNLLNSHIRQNSNSVLSRAQYGNSS